MDYEVKIMYLNQREVLLFLFSLQYSMQYGN